MTIGRRVKQALDEQRAKALETFDAFTWAQRNRIRNKLSIGYVRQRGDMWRDENDGIIHNGLTNERHSLDIQRRK